eukprot:scaffold1301_cov176-Ochromonas_danica.AAC.1
MEMMKSNIEKQDNTEEENRRKRRTQKKRGRAEEEEAFNDLLDDTPHRAEKEIRVEVEGRAKEAQALNDNFLAHQQNDDEIAVLLQDCSTNWQQMIESEDMATFKKLETYNAIHRIPVSLINGRFTVTVDGREIQAGGMSGNSSTMLLCILIGMGVAALHASAVKGNAETARLLLLHPAIDVNVVHSEIKYTPLHYACQYGKVEVVKVLLLDERVDVNKTTN